MKRVFWNPLGCFLEGLENLFMSFATDFLRPSKRVNLILVPEMPTSSARRLSASEHRCSLRVALALLCAVVLNVPIAVLSALWSCMLSGTCVWCVACFVIGARRTHLDVSLLSFLGLQNRRKNVLCTLHTFVRTLFAIANLLAHSFDPKSLKAVGGLGLAGFCCLV